MLPTLPRPNWASFWTGQSPGHHHIFAFAGLSDTQVVQWRADRRFLKRPSWLETASNHGRRVLSLYAPLTSPPQPVNGCVVGEHEAGDFTYPPELGRELRDRYDPLTVPRYLQFFPPGGFGGLEDIRRFVEDQVGSVVQTQEIAEYLLGKSPWDVAVIHFYAPDPLQHALWHGIDPQSPAFDPPIHREVGDFFRALDTSMGEVIQVARPSAVMVFSDHGFTTCHKILNVARALKEAGILGPRSFAERAWRRAQRTRGVGFLLRPLPAGVSPALRQGNTRAPEQPWRCAVDHESALYLDDKAVYVRRSRRGGEPADAVAQALESVVDPDTGERVMRKVWRAEDLYGGVDPPGWDILVLEVAEGYTVRRGDLGHPLFLPCRPNRDYLIGTHTREGLWVFSGEDIASVSDLDAGILDLPPTFLSYLGIGIPEWMDGKILPIVRSADSERQGSIPSA